MAVSPPVCDFGWQAPGFRLPGTDGRLYDFDDVAGPRGTLILWICNHCPYVQAVLDRIIRDAADLKALGIGVAAISSNDAVSHPEDGFEAMQALGLPFPYLYDESQQVAQAWGAACTPDFFGFDAAGGLQYRGRLDASGKEAVPGARRELYEAMAMVAETGHGPKVQVPSMGCSIKWKAA